MIGRSLRIKVFAISVELLQEMMTEGWQIGDGDILRCVNGLPPSAQFEYVYPGMNNTILLAFTHPTWPIVERFDNPPREIVTMQRIARPL